MNPEPSCAYSSYMDRYAAGSPAGGKTIRFLRIKAEGTGMNSFENAVNATYLIVRCGKQRYGIPLKTLCMSSRCRKIRKAPELPAYVLGKTTMRELPSR